MGIRGALIFALLLLGIVASAEETVYAQQIRQGIREHAYNYWTRQPSIQSILHYPRGPSHPQFPCADFVSWILEAAADFPKRPNDPLIVVQARANYRYMLSQKRWQIVGTYSLDKLPYTDAVQTNARPQGCLAYYYKKAPTLKFINIRHVGVIYLATPSQMKIIDASGHLGGIMYRDMNDEVLKREGGYDKVQILCPPTS